MNCSFSYDRLVEIGLEEQIVTKEEIEKHDRMESLYEFINVNSIAKLHTDLLKFHNRAIYTAKVHQYIDDLEDKYRDLFIEDPLGYQEIDEMLTKKNKTTFFKLIDLSFVNTEMKNAVSVLKSIDRIINILKVHKALRVIYGILYFFMSFALVDLLFRHNEVNIFIPFLLIIINVLLWFTVANKLDRNFIYSSTIPGCIVKFLICTFSGYLPIFICLYKLISIPNIIIAISCLILYFWCYYKLKI